MLSKMRNGEIWSKTFTLLFLLTIFDQMAFLCTRAIISKYALDLGFSETLAGVIAGALSVAALFSRPIAGRILVSSKVTHKTVLLSSVICSLLVVCGYMLFSDFVPLFLVRIFNGITYGVSGTVELTMASNTLSQKNMGRGIGLFGLGNIIGLAVAPTISVALYDGFGPKMLFVFCILTSLIAIVIALCIPSQPVDRNEAPAKEKSTRSERKTFFAVLNSIFAVEALVPSVLNFASQIAYASISAFIVVYGGLKGWEQIGLFYTVYSIALFVFRPINGRIYDKNGLPIMVVLGNLSFAFGIFLISVTDAFAVCLLAAVFCAYGYGGAICTYQADAIKSAGKARRGIASGTYFMLNDCGGFIGSTLAGIAVVQLGYSTMYKVFMLPLFAAIVFFGVVMIYRNQRKKKL